MSGCLGFFWLVGWVGLVFLASFVIFFAVVFSGAKYMA